MCSIQQQCIFFFFREEQKSPDKNLNRKTKENYQERADRKYLSDVLCKNKQEQNNSSSENGREKKKNWVRESQHEKKMNEINWLAERREEEVEK